MALDAEPRGPSAADAKRIAKQDGRLDLIGAPEGFDALVMADIVRARGGLSMFIARDGARSQAFIDALKFFAPEVEVALFPSWDCLPYDRIGPSSAVSAQRMATLAKLASGTFGASKPAILVTAAPAALQRVPQKAVVSRASYSAKVGNRVVIADLERYFAVNGYQRASTVSERGEFAIRGGVIDVFPPGAEEPVRLDLFGDTLESIRGFDPETQRSTKQLREVDLLPVSEALLDADAVSRFRKGYVSAFGAPGDDPLYDTISEGGRRAGLEHWLPLFYDGMATLFDYLPDAALVAVDHLAAEARDERLAMIADAYDARATADRKSSYRPLEPNALYLDAAEWDRRVSDHPNRRFTPFKVDAGEQVVDMGARLGRQFVAERAQDSVNLFEATADHAKALAAKGKRVLFASWSDGSSERLGAMLADHGLKGIAFAPYWQAAKAADPKKPQRVVLPLDAGFETENLAVISETDILGDRLARPRRKRRAANFLAEASALTAGDLVVHIDHGIGRYEGLKTLDVQGAPHDCLEIFYAGESKLYLPVENIDLLTRYGAEGDGVVLDKLGGAAWQARKARAKQRLREMAEGLIAIAAKRAVRSVDDIEPPSGVFDEFCARFPYEETEDQLNAIADVLGDLAQGKPMDRLICGDVGFGKTEVALRAAFVVAMSGKQVAVVCPTTLLARQHYKTFVDRFQGWPVKIRRLSRLAPAKEASETRAGLAAGEFEIVVGTLPRQKGVAGLDEEELYGDRTRLVVRPRHPLLRRKTLQWTELARYPWVLPPIDSLLHDSLMDACRKNGMPAPVSVVETLSVSVIREYLATWDAIASLPESLALRLESQDVIRPLPVDLPPLVRPVGMTWLRSRAQTTSAKLLMACMREVRVLLPLPSSSPSAATLAWCSSNLS
ncbi:MAG: DEAD/DEAH box helicase [Caulobacterales bacterium]|nr:DEAD/DEAH box helicase [Caulobacterales bacterium]